jgi:hypothetical protein
MSALGHLLCYCGDLPHADVLAESLTSVLWRYAAVAAPAAVAYVGGPGTERLPRAAALPRCPDRQAGRCGGLLNLACACAACCPPPCVQGSEGSAFKHPPAETITAQAMKTDLPMSSKASSQAAEPVLLKSRQEATVTQPCGLPAGTLAHYRAWAAQVQARYQMFNAEAARPARRIYVGGLPAGTQEVACRGVRPHAVVRSLQPPA